MATHSSIITWKIPWMEDPGRLQSMGLQRVRQQHTGMRTYAHTHTHTHTHPTVSLSIHLLMDT